MIADKSDEIGCIERVAEGFLVLDSRSVSFQFFEIEVIESRRLGDYFWQLLNQKGRGLPPENAATSAR